MPSTACLPAWVSDLQTLSATADPAAVRRHGRSLVLRWAEPHRRYHTGRHLDEMLGALALLRTACGLSDRDACLARVAAWLHDAIYDPHATAGASERASAGLARDLLSSLGVGPGDVNVVADLILGTIDHGSGPPGALADAFTDADLAILAAGPGRFDEYCDQVRHEYAHVPTAAYAAARSALLEALVDRDEVYRTAYARREWTARARANVRRELHRLAVAPG